MSRASAPGRGSVVSISRAAILRLVVVAASVAAIAAAPLPRRPERAAPQGHTPLVIVSFDGFRWDYLDRVDTPAFDRVARAGVRAERLIPVFPSKTFPGHYSVVTGLYPGHHGIISNNMRDPRWPEPFGLGRREEVQSARWWGGEPIWVTAKRQGLRTGVYFWPGSEAPIEGVRPDWWFPYDGSVAWSTRVDTALDWLTLPEGGRADLVAIYFEEPNDAGHSTGPDSSETTEAVRRADAVLGTLLDGLEARGVEANVMISSDHGMAANDPSRVILIDELAPLHEDELFEAGAVVQIFPRPGRDEAIYSALRGAHPHLSVYRRDEAPGRLHLYDNPRVAPILAVPDAGWEVVPSWVAKREGWHVIAGDHGQDPTWPDLHGIFLAAGPAFRPGARLGAVEQVDLYGLMCRALGVRPAPNDGDPGRVAEALR